MLVNFRKTDDMNTKLQELTDKIYLEGVEKGNAEAEAIIKKAEAEADNILLKAKQNSEMILHDANQKADNLMKNTQAELKLFAQQSLHALKSEITDLICGIIVENSVKAATEDKNFMQKIMLTMVEELAKNQSVTIEAKQAEKLKDYFIANAKSLLNQGVSIKEVNNIKTDFNIVLSDNAYKINFGEDEFIAYFKEFLRPKLIEMLF